MIRVRPMTAADVPLGMALKQRAGWNQTEADWRRFLTLGPGGCFVAEYGGAAAGTTTTAIFGGVAWVAMVLVEESLRGRGVGTALMTHALAYLDGRGVGTVRLDATPLGRPVYEKLGFVAEYELARHEGALPPSGDADETEPVRQADLAEVLELDARATGADRGALLLRLFEEAPDGWRLRRRGGAVAGFVGGRAGARATQVGPCVADASAGPVLLAGAWRRLAGRAVYVDVPVGHAAATALAAGPGLTVQRRLLRMYRGESPRERAELLWASAGPEKG